MHPLMYIWGEIWGCRLGMGDVKDYSGGVVKSHNFHFVYFINILQDICFNLLCRWESSIPHIISQTTGENPMFLWFFRKKIDFLLIFMYILNTFKSARESWLNDVMVTSYEVQWYSLWSQWIEEIHTYTLVANIGVSSILYRKSREGIATTPFWGCVTKNTSWRGGLSERIWKCKISLIWNVEIL